VQLLGEEEGEGGFWYFTFSDARDVNLEGANAEVACWDGWAKKKEGGDGSRLGWKRREEAGPKLFLGLKSSRVNQFELIYGLKIGLEIE
jgi:hypothetical protein